MGGESLGNLAAVKEGARGHRPNEVTATEKEGT